MSQTVIRVENVSKQYRLGLTGTGTLSHDLNRWWHLVRGKEDPYLKIGETNDRGRKGQSEYVWPLKNINFEVRKGEVLGIIGQNGAGKSTLLKILSKVTTPTTGSVKLKGRVASLLEVGTGFHPELTGRENVFMNGAILGMTRGEIQRKFDEIVDFSGVERYIDTPVKRYSSGMYVRLAFAVAAHLEPEILIVDEVLAVGDAEFQKKCLGKMQDVSGHGRTVLFVSHNMGAVKSLCTRALLLRKGEIIYEGDTDQTIRAYLAEYKETSYRNLEELKDRSGTGEVMLSAFYLENSRGEASETFSAGDAVTLVFKLKIYTASVQTVDVGFSLHSMFGETYSILYSSYQEEKIEVRGENYLIVRCTLNSFNFSPGEYYFKARILADHVEADWPKVPIGKIIVEPGHNFISGKAFRENKAPVLLKGKWEYGNAG